VRSLVLIPLLLVLSACSARETGTPVSETAVTDAAAGSDGGITSVPFLVDDLFVPSGCMGDCTASVTIDEDCPQRGTIDAQGKCHHFVYSLNTAPGALGWAGVMWQTVDQNWGSQEGRPVAPGATLLHFYAKSAGSDVAITVLVGALNANDGGKACKNDSGCASLACVNGACAVPHHDTLNLPPQPAALSSDWKEFTVEFNGQTYGAEVMSGFGWTAAMPPKTTKIEFYVDDLRWE